MKLPARTIAAVYSTLLEIGRTDVAEALDDVRAETGMLEQLVKRYQLAEEFGMPTFGGTHVAVAAWLVARTGPNLKLSTAEFEALLATRNNKRHATTLVAPKWMLSEPAEPALQRRAPCWPVVRGNDEELYFAYKGLVDHVCFLSRFKRDADHELLDSSIPWRIVALADCLEPERGKEDYMTYRFGRLRARTVNEGSTSSIEKSWWNGLDAQEVVARRHALSHLGERDTWTFLRCIQNHWEFSVALEATAGISLAVLAAIARDLRDSDPPENALQAVLAETAFLDDHIVN